MDAFSPGLHPPFAATAQANGLGPAAPYSPLWAGRPGDVRDPRSTARDDWQGKLLGNVRLESIVDSHLEAHEKAGNAPCRERMFDSKLFDLSDLEEPKGGRVSAGEANKLEMRETEVQNRYEAQQQAYTDGASRKRKVARRLKKGIQDFSKATRRYRGALKDMRTAERRDDPASRAASMKGLVDGTNTVINHVQGLVGQARQIQDADRKIREAQTLVKREEVAPEDLSPDTSRRQALSSHLQRRIEQRNLQDLDSDHAMEVGHFEKDWAASASEGAMELVEQGMQMAQKVLRDHEDHEKDRRAGKEVKNDNLPQGNYRGAEISVEKIGTQQLLINNALKELRQ